MFNRKTLLFTITFVAFLVIASIIHFRFLDHIVTLGKRKNILESQQIILKDAAAYLSEVRAQLCEVKVMTSSPLQQKQYTQDLHQSIATLKRIMSTMRNGGMYQELLSSKPFEEDAPSLVYTIEPFDQEILSHLVTSLSKIDRYEQEVNQFTLSFLQTFDKKIFDTQDFLHMRHKLSIKAKNKDAFFRRLDANFNQILTHNLSQLHQITRSLDHTQQLFRLFSMLMTAGMLIVAGWFTYFSLRRTQKQNQALLHQLNTDDLTQLQSRRALSEKTFETYSIVYLIDLDHFSDTNSLYGNAIGDRLLQAVAQRFKKNCSGCSLHRFGGDLFALMAQDLRDTDLSIKKQIHHIEDLIEGKAFIIDEHKIQVGITIGVGVGVEAISQAMLALDIAKTEKKPYRIYSRRNRHTRMIQKNLVWQKRINKALKENRVVPFIQPIVDREGRARHYECLMRIAEPSGKSTFYVPPVFLETAKKAKLYPRLSRTMIQKSFEKFHDGGHFSINLSYLDIMESGTKFFLEELIERHHAHGRVTFELLEHESLDDVELVKSFLESFKSLGVKIAIDDFGSHYSNLMEIIRFRPDYIKIDGSLIQNLSPGNDAYIAVRSIVQFAHQLKIKIIAEYVADQGTFTLCKNIGIDLFQGYYFSPAVQNFEEIPTDPDGTIIPGQSLTDVADVSGPL
jgi:diguanylate cyclase (GGDEF)-like protein